MNVKIEVLAKLYLLEKITTFILRTFTFKSKKFIIININLLFQKANPLLIDSALFFLSSLKLLELVIRFRLG